MGCSKINSKREVYISNTILPQETRKTSNRQLNFTLKQLEKEKQNSRRKQVLKIQAEINEKEMKKK